MATACKTSGSAGILIVDESLILVHAIADAVSRQPDMQGLGRSAPHCIPRDIPTSPPPTIAVLNPLQGDLAPSDLVQHFREDRGVQDLVAYLPQDAACAAHACLRAGFAAVVSRDRSMDKLVTAISTVLADGIYADEQYGPLSDTMIAPEPKAQDPFGLTPREQSVLEGVARGASSKEVARDLGISPKTVETHRARAMRKLGLTARSELVEHSRLNGW
ncbi:response regulator transcription factor [Roseivivax isoporae]|uniref:HTH luxR-type domain-containing protein n=1 Tax=Roseivivax isoporae LMG 25204 TaxID=1449351 RepID=X7F470_9RHOB|nr:response regulator transcription factor [Roseivivax isoporae]ETX26869.1 hypothetical protein RISW2_18715 [Roseivivax isoporae LMG 25204]